MSFDNSIFRTRLVLAFCATLALVACSSDDELEYQELTVFEIYSQATEYLEDGRYRDASLYYDEVERQHPYSVWATKSKLMAAYSHYMNNKYDEATASLDRFIQVHPGNRDVVYAYYLKAQRVRALIARDFTQAYEKCDVILTPTTPGPRAFLSM